MIPAHRGSRAGDAPPLRLSNAADGAWRRRGPNDRAVRAFGVRQESLRPLNGGQGLAWTDDRIVIKPVGCVPEHSWVCEVYAVWTAHDEVRVPEPLKPAPVETEPVETEPVEAEPEPKHAEPDPSRPTTARDQSAWTVDGWGAHVFVPGRDVDLPRELSRVKEASDAFHAHLEHLPRPDFMDGRDDPWAFGDRVAWEGCEPEGDEETLEAITRLKEHLRPVNGPAQVIHGDILPNVLLQRGSPPAVIDWPPYYRPVGMANAIAVTDAVTFRDAPLALLDEWATGDDWDQLLVRALLYRLGPTGIFAVRNRLTGSLVTHLERARPVIDAVLAR
jgi:hypothetical protein